MTTPPLLSGRFAATSIGAGVLAAVVLPAERPGLGVLAVALALGAAARAGRERIVWLPPVEDLREATQPPGEGPADVRWRAAWAVLTLLLASAPLLRDAVWVVVPALAGAVAFGSLAVAGGATWPGVFRGLSAATAYAPWGPWLAARAASAAAPSDARAHVVPALRGAALASVLLAVFGVLFATGDRAFAQLAGDALPTGWDAGPLPLRVLVLGSAVALAGGLALAHRVGAAAGPLGAPSWRLGGVEWGVGLVALNALVAAFVAVQFAVLFGRHDHVLRTAGLTYAEYAREGFVQLLVAAALTLAVAAAALRYSAPQSRRLVRALLATLLALTFVVLVSALHRLDLYTEAFGATRLRVTAQVTLLVVGALLALVLVALVRERFAWLPRACVLTVGLALAGLVALDPDHRIAERNVERMAETGAVDGAYLESLSADAVPALPERFRDAQRERLRDGDGLAGFSFARARARAALE